MGKFQQSYLRNLHKTTVGIATSIVPSKPIIYSWIPLDLNPPVSELEDPPIPEAYIGGIQSFQHKNG